MFIELENNNLLIKVFLTDKEQFFYRGKFTY